MLEACVDKRTGEIIVVKPRGAPWSAAERDGDVLVVVELDDRSQAMKLAEGTVLSYPYRVMGFDADDPTLEVMVAISRWKVDLQKLAPGAKFKRTDLKENLSDYPVLEVLR